ncbi:MAG: hypothetical protein KGN84_19255 [Acidobacteriota bacterium]|nr:hypothetical protein [Acidobacteriota bacterium]
MSLNEATLQAPPARPVHSSVLRTRPRDWPLTAAVVAAVILFSGLTVLGFPYYRLGLEDRPLSPLHPWFRSSGLIGLKLGFTGVFLFFILFLYPLRKRWRWLSGIGSTRRWLNAHALVGITAPIVITFHSAFRYHGLAGLAYWIMVSVAASGFVGRYLYAKIPRKLNSVKLTDAELQDELTALDEGGELPAEMKNLLALPSVAEIRRMALPRALWMLLKADVARPFQVSRLRRRALGGRNSFSTLGGLCASRDPAVEAVVRRARQLSRLRIAAAFLQRTERVFHLWHVIHRPFSLTFVVLVIIHVGVALSLGVR